MGYGKNYRTSLKSNLWRSCKELERPCKELWLETEHRNWELTEREHGKNLLNGILKKHEWIWKGPNWYFPDSSYFLKVCSRLLLNLFSVSTEFLYCSNKLFKILSMETSYLLVFFVFLSQLLLRFFFFQFRTFFLHCFYLVPSNILLYDPSKSLKETFKVLTISLWHSHQLFPTIPRKARDTYSKPEKLGKNYENLGKQENVLKRENIGIGDGLQTLCT